MNHDRFIVGRGKNFKMKDADPAFTGKFKGKDDAQEKLEKDIKRLAALQDILYAQDTYALLLIIQAMDAAGKDSVIEHVMSGVNPQGCQVYSFKAPSTEELDHDYLWRCMKALPERGRIGIFNRSYYEEVLVVRVHPEFLEAQHLPHSTHAEEIWEQRYEDINSAERYLVRNGIVILKFFLNVSKEKQKERFLERIDQPEKNWKFSPRDVHERQYWDRYMEAYEAMIHQTSTEWAPWHVIPADHKWFTRAAVADIIVAKLESLDLHYPKLSKERQMDLQKSKATLEAE